MVTVTVAPKDKTHIIVKTLGGTSSKSRLSVNTETNTKSKSTNINRKTDKAANIKNIVVEI